ncbi:MAG: NADH-quinone oxidoreductase subunit NuoE [Synergistaceae bacterium]|jgi:NADH-quinone oxidoreductase subunit E|nr:NADH-quinone oxidoreductase subunit NuoE [Synergistaceae bacterium]
MTTTQEEVLSKVREIVSPWKDKKGGLIPILQQAQHEFGYLPPEVVQAISDEMLIPLAEIYGVATFYAQFHLKPRGRHVVRVCRGTACHVRGSLKILEKLKETLHVTDNGTTEDLRFTLEPVACLGACGLAPVMTIDEQTFGRVRPEMLGDILGKFE